MNDVAYGLGFLLHAWVRGMMLEVFGGVGGAGWGWVVAGAVSAAGLLCGVGVGVGSRRDARAYAAGLETDRRRRVWIDSADGVVTVGEWVERWSRTLDVDPRTVESYRSRLRCHILPRFGGVALGAVWPLGVAEWARELQEAGFAPATVRGLLNLLSMIFADAVDERLVPANPVRRRRKRGRRVRAAVAEGVWAMPEHVVRIAD
ncbi:hypothetical protein [Amycolatopsis sp. NPDC051903]|uniref:hypothetical protein n=1 Tax=Amycolatopsis sp. NPDC051903 TaxID=3363936 RepID=UPI0037B58FC6